MKRYVRTALHVDLNLMTITQSKSCLEPHLLFGLKDQKLKEELCCLCSALARIQI